MIFDDADTQSEKLHKASQHFVNQLSRHRERRREMERAFAFRHGEQWDDKAKQELEDQGRPCLTFNLIAPISRELTGANQDQRREARAAPVGPEAVPTSQTLNALWKAVYEREHFVDVEDQVFDDMITGGVGFAFLDGQPSSDDPDETVITLERISPFQVLYDGDAHQLNLKDSTFFYWPKWMSETEFKRAYPKFADQFEELSTAIQETGDVTEEMRESGMKYLGQTPGEIFSDPKFYDAEKSRVRVVHLEYRTVVPRYWGWNERDDGQGRARGWERIQKDTYAHFKKTGGTSVRQTTAYEWHWFQFTGLQVLFDDVQPLPIEGPQIRSAACWYDEIKKYHYGMVRDLMDPQSEFNKRRSTELDVVSRSGNPGLLADEGAFADPKQAQRLMRRSGFILEKRVGLTVLPMEAAAPPVGWELLVSNAKDLIQTISGVDVDPMLGGQPDDTPVGTAMLSHRKALLSIAPMLGNFRAFQRGLLDAVIRTIIGVFSDDQIAAMLASTKNLRLVQGQVIDLETKATIPLRDLRSIRWSIEMEAAAVNTTQQLLVLNILQTLMVAGVPIDPEVLFDSLPVTRETRQQLLTYAQQAKAQAAQAQQADQKTAQDQVTGLLNVQAAQVTQRAQQGKLESQDAQRQSTLDAIVKLVQTFVSATGDQSDRIADHSNLKLDRKVRLAEMEVEGAHRAADRTTPQAPPPA